MTSIRTRVLALALAALAATVPASAGALTGPLIGTVGPGYFGTSNTSLDANIPINSGTAGARVNGEIALVGQFGDLTPSIQLNVVDVSLKDNPGGQPAVIGTLPGLDEHTFECGRDCTYAYGSAGTVVDLTDPTSPKDVGEWDDAVRAQTDPATGANYTFVASTHDVTQIAVPGVRFDRAVLPRPAFLADWYTGFGCPLPV